MLVLPSFASLSSLPLRERGLKFCLNQVRFSVLWSLPLRERGLKSEGKTGETKNNAVAPLAGAWIEIASSATTFDALLVAPLAGAWIEIEQDKIFVYIL